MKVNLSKQEYRKLLDLVYLGEWMLSANDDQPDPEKAGHLEIAQKIYALARDMGCETLIERSKETGRYMPTRGYDEETPIREYIDDYDSQCFWSELISRLTDRDVEAENRALNRTIESPEDYIRISFPIEEEYDKEFRIHGLRRLKLRDA